ncbi:MAG TPA: hypothetical protein VHX65_09450 [Pirellulales bacterium]|jgi:hypothetical protein|nr:hypothetical protein [Pirellulales bacterium]
MNDAQTNLTLKQRRRMQGSASPSDEQQRSWSGEISRTVAILILLLAFGVGTALGMVYFRPDPRLKELDDLQALMADAGSDMPQDIRDMLRDQFENVNDRLPYGERRMTREDWGFSRASAFLAKSSADQLADLERMVARQKQREEDQAQRELEAAANGSNANTGTSNGNSNNNGGRGRGGRNDEQRAQHQEQRLANHPPEQRAQFGLMRQMMNAVRQQQGMGPR